MSGNAEVGQEPFDRYYAAITEIADGQLAASRLIVQEHEDALMLWMARPAQATLPEVLAQTQHRLEANLTSLGTSMEICMGGLKDVERSLSEPVQQAASNIRMHMERCGGATAATEPPMRRMQEGLSDTDKAQLNIVLDHYRWNEIVATEAANGRSGALRRQLGGLSTTEVARAAHAVLDPYVWKRVYESASNSAMGVGYIGVIDLLRQTSTPESKQAMRAGLDVLCNEQVQDVIQVPAGYENSLESPGVRQLLRSASGAIALESMIAYITTPTTLKKEYEFLIAAQYIHPDTTLEGFTAGLRDYFDLRKNPDRWTSFYDEFESARFTKLTEPD